MINAVCQRSGASINEVLLQPVGKLCICSVEVVHPLDDWLDTVFEEECSSFFGASIQMLTLLLW